MKRNAGGRVLQAAVMMIVMAAAAGAQTGVKWNAWEPAAFERARAEKKPILIDVAASWCHWCHVMDEETYADAEVARILSQDFVAIRVDADARPDVAERYADWGWPATAVLTSEARPVLERRGFQEAPEFRELLRDLAARNRAGTLTGRIAPASRPSAVDASAAALKKRSAFVSRQLDGLYDSDLGGWGHRQKYPLAAPVEHLLWRALDGHDEEARRRAEQTLRGEARLIDPAFGGMYQYSIPETWDQPHFEKLAAIQAGALENFTEAWLATGDAAWLAHARSVLRYVDEFLLGPEGGFWTSQDADLGATEARGGTAVDGHAYYALDGAARRRLGIPRVDRNAYADLNGMLIRAHVRFYAATGDADALAIAKKAAQRLRTLHRRQDGGYAHAAVTGTTVPVQLADQVWVTTAFLALFESTGDPAWKAAAREAVGFLRSSLADNAGSGFFAHTADPAATGVFAERRKPLTLNGVAARVLLRLGRADHDKEMVAAAAATLGAFTEAEIAEEGRTVGELAVALAEITTPEVRLAIVRKPGQDVRALAAAALALAIPRLLIDWPVPGVEYPESDAGAVYICGDGFCSAPVTAPADIAEAVEKQLRRPH